MHRRLRGRASLILFVLSTAVVGSCTGHQSRPSGEGMRIAGSSQLVFLTRNGCVNTGLMRANVDTALKSLGMAPNYRLVDLDTLPENDPRKGYPTPTLLYANRDVFGMPEPPASHPPAT